MNQIPELLITLAIQASLLALGCIGIFSVTNLFKRSSTRLLSFGMFTLIGLWVCAMTPMPSWLEFPETVDTADVASNADAQPLSAAAPLPPDSTGKPRRSVERDGRQSESTAINVQQFLNHFSQQLGPTSETDSSTGSTFRWAVGVSIFLASCIFFGVTRLTVSWIGVCRLKRSCRPIADRRVSSMVDDLRKRTKCRQNIDLMECNRLSSPAMVGWRRPMILLPANWSTWSHEQLEAVIAHKVVHVARRDFFHHFVAQLGTAIHFYNPLVHWMSKRLLLEQELIADKRAALLVGGGQRDYLRALAALTLDNDHQKRLRLAPMFLPVRGTLTRRIKMLKNTSNSISTSANRSVWFGIAAIVMVAIGVIGLRLPRSEHSNDSIRLSNTTPNSQEDAEPATLDFVAGDEMVNIIRPASLLKNLKVQNLINEHAGVARQFERFEAVTREATGVSLSEIDQFTLCQTAPAAKGYRNYLIFKTLNDNRNNFDKIKATSRRNFTHNGKEIFEIDATDSFCPFAHIHDDRTIVWAQNEDYIRLALEVEENDASENEWHEVWDSIDSHQFIMIGDKNLLAGVKKQLFGQKRQPNEVLAIKDMDTLLDAEYAAVAFDFREALTAKLVGNYYSADESQSAKKMLEQLVKICLSEASTSNDESKTADTIRAVDVGKRLLGNIEMANDESKITVKTSAPIKLLELRALFQVFVGTPQLPSSQKSLK